MHGDERAELLDLYMRVARRFGEVMHETASYHDLTPMQAMTLLQVSDAALPTSQIALHLRCDPSNATGLVDQLERRGLVRRTTPSTDRRKRVVEATDDGRTVGLTLRQALAATRTRFDRLVPEDIGELRRILEILADDGPVAGPPRGTAGTTAHDGALDPAR